MCVCFSYHHLRKNHFINFGTSEEKKQTNVALCGNSKVGDKTYDLDKWMQRINATFRVFGILFRSCNIHFYTFFFFASASASSLFVLPTPIALTVSSVQ